MRYRGWDCPVVGRGLGFAEGGCGMLAGLHRRKAPAVAARAAWEEGQVQQMWGKLGRGCVGVEGCASPSATGTGAADGGAAAGRGGAATTLRKRKGWGVLARGVGRLVLPLTA